MTSKFNKEQKAKNLSAAYDYKLKMEKEGKKFSRPHIKKLFNLSGYDCEVIGLNKGCIVKDINTGQLVISKG